MSATSVSADVTTVGSAISSLRAGISLGSSVVFVIHFLWLRFRRSAISAANASTVTAAIFQIAPDELIFILPRKRYETGTESTAPLSHRGISSGRNCARNPLGRGRVVDQEMPKIAN